MRFATLDGLLLHYAFRPGPAETPTLVFINSLGTDFRIWDAVEPAFAGRFATLRYDKRGHGLSDVGASPYAMADHAGDLEALVGHLGIGPVILCGLSVGGLIAQIFADRNPDRVRALLLCDTAHKVGTPALWGERIAAIEAGGIEAVADPILERWFTPAFRRDRAGELAGCRNMLIRQPVAGYTETCAALRDADHTALARRIAVPTLCVVGDQDGSTPPELVRALADLIPGAAYEVIAGAGHIPCIEAPTALVALVDAFLERTKPA